MEIIFKRTHSRVKKQQHIDKNIFMLYASRTINIDPTTSYKINTEIIILIPGSSNRFVTSKFRGGEICRFNTKKQRLWVEILNNSDEDNLKLKKDSVIGFVIIEPEHLAHKHATKTQKRKVKKDKI